MCGGTNHIWLMLLHVKGLSPRVRGNRLIQLISNHSAGTIPACAGEPNSGGSGIVCLKDYPRVCGGTCIYRSSQGHCSGLSPRVRGNQLKIRISF